MADFPEVELSAIVPTWGYVDDKLVMVLTLVGTDAKPYTFSLPIDAATQVVEAMNVTIDRARFAELTGERP